MANTDNDIQKDILAELSWEPTLRDDDIAVGVRDGVVTLGGYVDSYADKGRAERAAARIKGVKAVANEIEVKLPVGAARADTDIARAALDALRWDVNVPHERIRVRVEDGWITLEGDADWHEEKDAATEAVRRLAGVRGVFNLITLRAQPTPRDVKQRIKEAFHRGVELDAERITVEVVDHKAILDGTVRSFAELEEAERAARKAPGITDVENRLTVVGALAAV